MDEKLKRLLQEEMERDAQRIMEEVNSDPSMKDVEAPEIIHERLFKQIREYEEQKARSTLSEEDKELIRLGKKYKKRRKWNKYIILIAAVVCTLAVGVTSIGGPKRVWKEVEGMLGGKEQTYVDTNGERTGETKTVTEVEAYEQVEKEFNFYPVRLYYLLDGMEFKKFEINKSIQCIQIFYQENDYKLISYTIRPNYRTGSIGADVEDEVIKEYEKESEGTLIRIKQYSVENGDVERWRVEFEYKEVQYSLLLAGMDEVEVEKVVENLYFS